MTDLPAFAPLGDTAVAPSVAAAATDPERARIAEGTADQPGRWWATARVASTGDGSYDDRHVTRHALREHHPDPRDGCGAAGELGASGDADGDGAGRVCALAVAHALRPGRPDLAEPRPLRPLDGARLDAALLVAPPDRGAAGRPRAPDPG